MRDQNIHGYNYIEGAKIKVLCKECIFDIFVLVQLLPKFSFFMYPIFNYVLNMIYIDYM
jgi:hypothetical protein